jgi:hypothetical protein
LGLSQNHNCIWNHVSGGLPGVFVNNTFPNVVNGSRWILPTFFKLYILVVLVGLIGLFKKKKIMVLLALILILAYLCNSLSYLAFTKPYLSYIHYNDMSYFLSLHMTSAAIFFIIGVLYYLYKDYIKYDLRIAILLAII